jgi:hypothetical protein
MPSALRLKSLPAKNFRPSSSSSWRMRWLTALGVTLSSSAARFTLRSRATASKACRPWVEGRRGETIGCR